MLKTNPDVMVEARAMAARNSVLCVIVFRESGEVHTGSGFVIKSDSNAQQFFVLTSDHFLGTLLAGDVLRVRFMNPGGGVQELSVSIIVQNSFVDVALLRVPGLMNVLPLPLAPGNISEGQSIIAIGYCNPDDLFVGLSFTRIPALSPGCVRPEETFHDATYDGIEHHRALLECISMSGMLGGPIMAWNGVVAIVDAGGVEPGGVGFTLAVTSTTILQVLKKLVGLAVQDDSTMEQVIDLIT